MKVGLKLLDNSSGEYKLGETLKELLKNKSYSQVSIATGYWDLPGMVELYDELKEFLERDKISFRLILGEEPSVRAYQLRKPATQDPNFPEKYLKRESLYYPLMLSPIVKIDDDGIIDQKIKSTAKFLDIFTMMRVLIGKAITQSTIRNNIYELVKSVRNVDLVQLNEKLSNELASVSNETNLLFNTLRRMDNWGFFHYLFARLKYKKNPDEDFSALQRSKKQSSYILYKFFDMDEKPSDIDEPTWSVLIDSVAGHCLVRRNDYDAITSKKGIRRLQYLVKSKYLPEMEEYSISDINDFFVTRDYKLRLQIKELLEF